MSLASPESTLSSRLVRAGGVLAVLRAAWRLSRVLTHVLYAYIRSWLVWPHLSAQGRDDESVRWSRQLLGMLGIQLVVRGQARPGAKLVVANHVSWLDIVAINAVVPSRFVSKAEVGRWPLVGRVVTQAGTLFLTRERRRDAMRVLGLMAKGLREGHTLAVFPEGTTGTGHGVLHFHPNLLQAAIDAGVPVQPVVLRYADPVHEVSPLAAYVGDTSLLQSLWWVVSARGLVVHVQVLPLQAVAHADRRALAVLLQEQIGAAVLL
ncbi:1-acyl-sn-glycerol-3-phosphate acyltransferase [Aquabacterium sp.]|jgi:1-acyl-sn-glycerol-3-phosphate acyltransferase|uniref:lysophospholipid acyltransferase family protein n=1 Tax=Aquabacterium sp. TaxID=1872578 RepID=UPI0025BA87DE|nr:lysophospholipid acyltransferase family protein [Aquabacterium sp.]MDQ5925972.1 1-acyl-sn-glycerol-3-phosphate acyltransferase [Pseudomonadota bacterium]